MTDLRREQILEAAAAVIADRGLAETRIADVADRLEISPALVLYYFDSKDVLLAEALASQDRQFFDSVAAAMAEESSPTKRLVTLIEASCPVTGADEDYVLWIEMWSRSRHDAGLARSRREMDARWREAISSIVEDGQEAGEFDGSVEPTDFALRLAALVDGLAIQVVLGDDDVSPATMRRLCLEACSAELDISLP